MRYNLCLILIFSLCRLTYMNYLVMNMKFVVLIFMSLSFSAAVQIDKLEGIQTPNTSSYHTTIICDNKKNEYKII